MARQLNFFSQDDLQKLSAELTEVLMTVGQTRYRITIQHIHIEIEKEQARYERLKMPRLKHASGVRLAMLKERLKTNEQELRELLVTKGFLSDA